MEGVPRVEVTFETAIVAQLYVSLKYNTTWVLVPFGSLLHISNSPAIFLASSYSIWICEGEPAFRQRYVVNGIPNLDFEGLAGDLDMFH